MSRQVITLVAVLVIAISSYGCGNDANDKPREYEDVTIDELFDALNENELAAEDEYVGKYVRVTGELRNIDSSEGRFTIDDDGFLTSRTIECEISNHTVRDELTELAKGNKVVVRGRITEIHDGFFDDRYRIRTDHVESANEADGATGEDEEAAKQDDNGELSPAMKNFIDRFNAVTTTPLSDIEVLNERRFRCTTSGRTIFVTCDGEEHYSVSIQMDKSLGVSWIKYVVHDFAQAFDPASADELEAAWYRAGTSADTATEDLVEDIGSMRLSVNYGYQEIDGVSISWESPKDVP